MLKVMWHFFVLGLYSFGGPAAHIGYFQREFVQKKKWLDEQDFTQAVALCQFLPGPASSQLGMFIGYKQGGYLGALAAFVGFTFPSFLLLTFLAMGSQLYSDAPSIDILIQSAKLLAVIVVADALWGMAKKNITDKLTLMVAGFTAVAVFFSTGLLGQITPILLAALLGYLWSFRSDGCVDTQPPQVIRPNFVLLGVFVLILLLMPLVAQSSQWLTLFNVFYQAGSFVFGGGHVVLPLLEPMLNGMVESDAFLSAYASAQLVPGPMFTMASYLGASYLTEYPVLGSVIATIAIFLPGSLLLFAFLPAWKALFSHHRLKASITLVNACVVGLLASAFVKPVVMTSISSWVDTVIVVLGFLILKYRNIPVWLLITSLSVYKFMM